MPVQADPARTNPAVVCRAPTAFSEVVEYLKLTPAGPAAWTSDVAGATPFASMREATRAATRLPAALRAYGLPLGPEARRRLH